MGPPPRGIASVAALSHLCQMEERREAMSTLAILTYKPVNDQ